MFNSTIDGEYLKSYTFFSSRLMGIVQRMTILSLAVDCHSCQFLASKYKRWLFYNIFAHPYTHFCFRYSTWAKKNKGQLETLKDFLLSKESQLRSHPEYNEVHPDDLEALRSFKESLGMKETIIRRGTQTSYVEDDEMDDHATAIATPSPGGASTASRRRISTAGSQISRMSTQSSLPPVYEEDGGMDSDSSDEASPLKRRKLDTSSSVSESVAKIAE